jgi:DNA repair protein RecO (recombination protein O)
MSSHRTEAIVLKVIPFQDAHQIATLFTPDLGLCKAIGSYSRSPKNALFGCMTPLSHIEVIFRPSKSDLLKIETASLLNPHQELRKSYDLLQLGCSLISCITEFQFPNKPAPLLFNLLKSYLSLLLEARSPEAILASFQLKLLRHEGLIAVTNHCGICGAEPKEIALDEGKTVCASHSSPLERLNEEETTYFYALALATSINLLKEIEIPATLPLKVTQIYETLCAAQ